MSFSDQLSFLVHLSVILSHFHLLLQNHWANFNQIWFKASLGEGDSVLFKRRARPFPRGDNYEIVKIHWQKPPKLLQNRWANFNQTWHKAFFGEGNSNLFKWRITSFSRGDNYNVLKGYSQNFRIFFSMVFLRWAMWPVGLLFSLLCKVLFK